MFLGSLLQGGVRKIKLRVEFLFSKQLSGVGFGLFRISFFSILLLEVIQIFEFNDVIFPQDNYMYSSIMCAWMASIAFLIVGYQTKIASFLNFVISIGVLSRFLDYEYHIDYVYLAVSFLCLWAPLENRLSLSNFLKKKEPRGVPVAYYYLFVAIGLGSIYAESCFHKIDSKAWLEGLGVWLPASLPQFAAQDWSVVLNNKLLVQILGYFTLIFETMFIFLMWFRSGRLLLIFSGIGLHLGILLVFPIPFFGLAMIVQYLLLVPDRWFAHFRWFGSAAKYYFGKKETATFSAIVAFAIIMQVFAFMIAPKANQIQSFPVFNQLAPLAYKTQGIRTMLFGMTPHAMFVDGHFTGTLYEYEADALVKSTSGESAVRRNILSGYISGRFWVNWMFGVGRKEPEDPYFKDHVERYVRHWGNSENLGSDEIVTEFNIRRRQVSVGEIVWRKDFYKERQAMPFQEAGKIFIESGVFHWELSDLQVGNHDGDGASL